MTRSCFTTLLASLLLACVLPLQAPNADPPPQALDIPPKLSFAEAMKALNLADGLEIHLLAHEPMVQQPLCINFDDRGRLWMLQYRQYPIPEGLKPVEVDQYLRTRWDKVPEPPPHGPKGADKIVILEDPDENGRYRKSTDVLTNMNLATGFCLGRGGIYVLQSPYLLFYRFKPGTDTIDGDPDVLLKGFGMEDPHSYANSLTWGPDGWLYGTQGSTVTANIRGIEFQQGTWRYHPTTKEFELFAEGGGNNWGIDFDRHGQLFVGGNTTEPLVHQVQGGYYIKSFGKHGALHNPYAFGFINALKHHGFLGHGLTGGFVLYQGGLFSERYRGAAIYSNLRDNAMRVSRVEANGSTFGTYFQEDFITTNDRWFRPVKSLVGPDGAIYVCDWCDYNISHTDPKDRSKWYAPSKDTGRLYRVQPAGSHPKADGKWPLSKLTSDELVDLLSHPNVWYSREARRILSERRDPAVCLRLEKMVQESMDDRGPVEALWALYVSGGLTDELAMKFLDHPVDHVRAWTVRLLGDRRQVARPLAERFVKLAKSEPSPTVRNQLACTCKRLPATMAMPIVEQLLGRAEDLNDVQIPLLIWWAIEDKSVSDIELVLKLAGSADAWDRPITKAFIVERLARRYLAEGKPATYAACARLLEAAPAPAERERVVRAMEQQLDGLHLTEAPPTLGPALTKLLAEPKPSSALVRLALRVGLEASYPVAVARVTDSALPAADRADFVRTLGELQRPESLAILLKLLEGPGPDALHAAILPALQRYDSPKVAAAIIERYPKMSAALKDKARDALVSRPAWSEMLVTAVEKGAISNKDVGLEQARRIFMHKDAKLDQRAEKLFGRVRPASSREKQGRIMAVSQILRKGPGDPVRGKPLVAKNCLNCHQLFGEGEKIGPDLTAVDRKNLDVLLMNVFDPSAVIREGYQQFNVTSLDGRKLSGLLAENTPEKVVVLDAKGMRTTLRQSDIESMTRSESSLMPEGILVALTDQELRDFFAYLRSEPALPAKKSK